LPAIRLAGIYLALATGAFAVLLEQWIFLLPRLSVFGHHFEIFGGGTLGVSRPSVLGLDLTGGVAYFIYSAVIFAAMVLLVVAVRRSVFGLRLIATKDAPAAIATTGIDARRVRLVVFALSAAIAGVGGAIIAGSQQSIAPDSYGLFAGLPILLLMVVFGISSPGSAVVVGLFIAGREVLAGLPLGPFHPLFEGGGVVQSMLIGCAAIGLARNPSGVLPTVRHRVALGLRRRSDAAGVPDPGQTGIAPELLGLTERPTASAIALLDEKLGLPAHMPGDPARA
jgi:branched-chain amino acid transport system permease protein